MKKMLMTLAAAGVLAVPVGVIVAESDPTEPTEPTPTTVEPDQVRDRQRLAEHEGPDEAPGPSGGSECDCEGSQVREREQQRSEDGAGDGPMMQQREQHRFEAGNDEAPMVQQRQQHRLETGECDGQMMQQREQRRLDDGNDDAPMVQEREQHRLDDGNDDAPMMQQREQRRLDDGNDDTVGSDAVETVAVDTVDGANLHFRYGDDQAAGNR